LHQFTTEDHGKILTGWHNLWAAYQGTEESIELFEAHPSAGIHGLEEVVEAVKFGVGQRLSHG
jgi:hypothetical protein